jgi:hypothetical protein
LPAAAASRYDSRTLSDPIHAAPHGQNLVIETRPGRVIIGRFDSSNGFEVLMHDCDVYDPPQGADVEGYIRESATYGVDVKHRDFSFAAGDVVRWRKLGDVPKIA